jgi:hypothetical protein
MKTPWTKNPESNRIAEVVSQGRSMTWGELLVSDGADWSVSVQLGGGAIIKAPAWDPVRDILK